jgi:hypothetical protein
MPPIISRYAAFISDDILPSFRSFRFRHFRFSFGFAAVFFGISSLSLLMRFLHFRRFLRFRFLLSFSTAPTGITPSSSDLIESFRHYVT